MTESDPPPKPGTEIPITIDGLKYMTIIDDAGLQRFPQNRLIRYLVDSHEKTSLEDMWHMADAGMISRWELMSLYMAIGYTLNGFAELFANSEIENPLWKDKG